MHLIKEERREKVSNHKGYYNEEYAICYKKQTEDNSSVESLARHNKVYVLTIKKRT